MFREDGTHGTVKAGWIKALMISRVSLEWEVAYYNPTRPDTLWQAPMAPVTSTAPRPHSRIVVGLSGGVDSSVAALLLQQAGHDLRAVFMKNWEEDDNEGYCAAEEDLSDADAVAATLGIPLQAVNFAHDYWERVFETFLSELRAGRTPNPDVLCNREIKFRAFLDYALETGAEFIATGHYARIHRGHHQVQLLKALDGNKDQSYFLYMLGQAQLDKALFPLGELIKTDVRRLAEEAGLITHGKKDSTGICFIGERDFSGFVSRYIDTQPGPMTTPDGHIVGEHTGLSFYTIGQRQGLGIGGNPGGSGEPWYVAAKEPSGNRLIVVQGRDHLALLSPSLEAIEPHWVAGHAPELPLDCHAKTRYRQPDQPCRVQWGARGRLLVKFKDPQWGVAVGQSVVFYQGPVCLGGAIIDQSHPLPP